MANKKKRKRQREAAARKLKEQQTVTDKPKAVWDASKAAWVPSPENDDHLYNVAVQVKPRTPMFVGFYRAPNETELLKLVCMNVSVKEEGELEYLEIHLHRPDNKVELIREGKLWPQGVELVRVQGITQRGSFGQAKRVPAKQPESNIITPEIKSSARPKDPPKPVETVISDVVAEKKIPRVPYTIKQAA